MLPPFPAIFRMLRRKKDSFFISTAMTRLRLPASGNLFGISIFPALEIHGGVACPGRPGCPGRAGRAGRYAGAIHFPPLRCTGCSSCTSKLRYFGYFSLYPFVFTFSMFNYDFTNFRCPFLDTVPINRPFFHISPAHFGYAILLQ